MRRREAGEAPSTRTAARNEHPHCSWHHAQCCRRRSNEVTVRLHYPRTVRFDPNAATAQNAHVLVARHSAAYHAPEDANGVNMRSRRIDADVEHTVLMT